jgi:hypothetical protein
MSTRAVVETGRDRRALVADAGFKQLSLASAVAGVFVAYGAFAVLAGLIAGVIDAIDVDVDVVGRWEQVGTAGGLVVAALLLVAYLFGGYVAGRMARRAGVLHGVAVFVLGLAVAALAAVISRQLGGAEEAVENLRSLGVPTTAAEWGDVATVAGLASLAGMLVGALVGGVLGERWHAKLVARALDPAVGAEAEARRQSEQRAAEAEERRTGAFRRVRAATPTRTRRVDTGGDDVDRDGVDDRVQPAPPTTTPGTARPDTPPRARRVDAGGDDVDRDVDDRGEPAPPPTTTRNQGPRSASSTG